ncbi:uncharacterized protein LOC125060127 [Pieris napi]|uniref:Uncharacterized protein n=1 Tax=Pieris macdunnoughi TaxID=345717 RepID=A0A821QZU9_9NEOP|nr:uncharacterized protein LOC125060127 [Pieris napi]CAF4829752.1 unnamed protein product [Pieris macdunnoughi]
MFVNGVEVINTRLESFTLKDREGNEMHSNSEKSPIPKARLPLLHLTPSGSTEKREATPPQRIDNPWLLRVQNNIPNTPPPRDDKPNNFFPHRIG